MAQSEGAAQAATMTQDERLKWLVDWLIAENPRSYQRSIPEEREGRQLLLRALMNIRPPLPVSDEFLAVQDAYLRQRNAERGIVQADGLPRLPGDSRLSIWQGDITCLAADAIVNAANSKLLGCFQPLHACIDNCIHTYAGVQLRLECDRIMEAQGHDEPTGSAKITPAYNLPSEHVLHTVGPIVMRRVTARDATSLASSYRSCLDLAAESGCHSVAFCCISTGVFGYPQEPAAKVSVDTVKSWLDAHSVGAHGTGTNADAGAPQGGGNADGKGNAGSTTVNHVIFNVFKDEDLAIYRRLLG